MRTVYWGDGPESSEPSIISENYCSSCSRRFLADDAGAVSLAAPTFSFAPHYEGRRSIWFERS